MISTARNLLAITALLAPALQAQTLIALEDGNNNGVPIVHEITLNGMSISSCPLPAAAGLIPLGPTLGSVSWTQGGALSTDGMTLAQTDLACNLQASCAVPFPNFYHAIAADNSNNVLYFGFNNMIGATSIGCPTGPVQWTAPLPAPLLPPLVGMEWDSQAGSLWVVDAGGMIAELQIVAGAIPPMLNVVQAFPMMAPPGAFVAMPESIAVNPCTQQLFLTDIGGSLIVMSTTGNPQGVFAIQGLVPGNFIAGLSLKPQQVVNTGGGCTGFGCPACAVPLASTSGGDPILGNNNFSIDVSGAPFDNNGPSIALLLLDFQPGPVNIGLCGPLQVGLTPNAVLGNLGNVLPGIGPIPCHGTTSAPFPIPNLPQLCGINLYAQWGLVCTANGGISLSNGLMIPIN